MNDALKIKSTKSILKSKTSNNSNVKKKTNRKKDDKNKIPLLLIRAQRKLLFEKQTIQYLHVKILQTFLNKNGEIYSFIDTNLNKQNQKILTKLIKRARSQNLFYSVFKT